MSAAPAHDNPVGAGASSKELEAIRGSALYNEDLAPTKAEERRWGAYEFAALWIGMAICIPSYMLASSLIAGGMN